ncbi:MAG TPA: metallophosphoesterase [Verrucomicrobiae bacterium]|nr:metallophosphoesterase [Verrucomicrobiae bacterium]
MRIKKLKFEFKEDNFDYITHNKPQYMNYNSSNYLTGGNPKSNKSDAKSSKNISKPQESDSLEKWIEYVNNINDDELDFQKECKNYKYIPPSLPPVRRIIVLGDIHGDYDLMRRSLRISRVIDKQGNWIAEPKNTVVVQVGDQIDRCRPYIHRCEHKNATYKDEASDIKIMNFMTKLREKAKKYGGEVINLLGNHEIMNSQGNMTYVSYKGLEEFKDYVDPKNPQKKFKNGAEARIHAFKPGNQYGKYMACTRISSVIIGSWLFVHAAILPALMHKFKMSKCDNIRKVNTLIRKWLLGQININSVRTLLNSDKLSPFWPRVLGNIPPNKNSKYDDCQKYVEPVLKTLQVGKIIVGHTPQYYIHHHGINFTCSGKLGRADIGSSKAFHPFDVMSEDLQKEKQKLSKKPIKAPDRGHTSSHRIIQVLEILNDTKCRVIEYKNGKITIKKYS